MLSRWTPCAEAQVVPVHIEFPRYPEMALQAQVQGKVHVRVHVAIDGTVETVRLVDGHELLATPALQSARAWRFPRMPQTDDFELIFDFRLEKERTPCPRDRVFFDAPNIAVIASNPPPKGGDSWPTVPRKREESQ